MSFFNFFQKKRADLEPHAVAETIFMIARQEFTELPGLWPRTLGDSERVALLFEHAMILFNVVDRLAFAKYGDPRRAIVMNETLRILRAHFCSDVQNAEAVGEYFDAIFDRSCDRYASAQSIMGEASLTTAATIWLCQNFAFDPDEPPVESVVLETGKAISAAVIAMLSTAPFKPLSGTAA